MVITIGGSTIGNTSVDLIGFKWSPKPFDYEIIEKKSPIGGTYYVKCAGKTPTNHTLELSYLVSTPKTIIDRIENLITFRLETLSIPEDNSYTNCRISASSECDVNKVQGDKYTVSLSLTITQYPE